MTYNILAFNFTKADWFPYCSTEYLSPKHRAPIILQEVKDLNADVICFQEVDYDLFDEFYKENLEALNYYIFIKKSNRTVTIITAIKKDKFTIESEFYLNLNQGLENYDSAFSKHKEALFSVISLKNSPKNKVVICNTHLFWNPEYEFVKYGQICVIVNYLEKNFKKLPIILAGDLNSLPWSNVLKYLYRIKPSISTNTKGDYNNNIKGFDH